MLRKARDSLDGLGWEIEEAEPDLREADEVFDVLRALSFVRDFQDEYSQHREQLKETLAANIEAGLRLTPSQIASAQTTTHRHLRPHGGILLTL